MGNFFETDEIKGYAPFKCYVCGMMLISDIHGEYTLRLECRRCKTKITLETVNPLPVNLVVKNGELIKL